MGAEDVVTLGLIAGIVSFLAGAVLLVYEWWIERPVRSAAKQTSEELNTPETDLPAESPIKAQGGAGEAVNAIANLAKSLKDLDRSTRLLVVSLAFFAIAAAAAIGDAIGTGPTAG